MHASATTAAPGGCAHQPANGRVEGTLIFDPITRIARLEAEHSD